MGAEGGFHNLVAPTPSQCLVGEACLTPPGSLRGLSCCAGGTGSGSGSVRVRVRVIGLGLGLGLG